MSATSTLEVSPIRNPATRPRPASNGSRRDMTRFLRASPRRNCGEEDADTSVIDVTLTRARYSWTPRRPGSPRRIPWKLTVSPRPNPPDWSMSKRTAPSSVWAITQYPYRPSTGSLASTATPETGPGSSGSSVEFCAISVVTNHVAIATAIQGRDTGGGRAGWSGIKGHGPDHESRPASPHLFHRPGADPLPR